MHDFQVAYVHAGLRGLYNELYTQRKRFYKSHSMKVTMRDDTENDMKMSFGMQPV